MSMRSGVTPHSLAEPAVGSATCGSWSSGLNPAIDTLANARGVLTRGSRNRCLFGIAAEAAAEDFAQRLEVVVARAAANFEPAILPVLGDAVFEDHQGANGERTLDVGDVVALDAAGEAGQVERDADFEEGLAALAFAVEPGGALQVQGLGGVAGGHFDESALGTALGGGGP